jgi:bisphosphoglycerate-dependent phosphoglycerate mutase
MITKTSIITTHSNRLRCLLKELIPNQVHYKNCSIIELIFYIRLNKIHYKLNMIYSGFSDKKSGSFFTSNEKQSDEHNILFPSISSATSNLLGLNKNNLDNNTVYHFFLIRHGQSTHNLYKNLSRIKSPFNLDTSLTNKGINQAIKAGEYLYQYLKCHNLSINYLFCSDLKRTRQTMLFICSQLKDLRIHTITVLPCAHELLYTKDVDCDKNMLRHLAGIAGENRMNCDTTCVDKKNQCCEIKYKNLKLNIDWSIYNHFYGNSTRSAIYLLNNKKACTNTNMLIHAIHYIN